ncbi:hypothetical protein A2Z33_04120 [Candidatus Gottesmanbacteria bacterium RBG_16_52_11]|uniref:Glycosyltransferase RgtA/B/C/D-like domain-containing protein n=1 Tax=Candidatus Gottesmanbacteria bacterium RBG_16_52_11 TaxID=1798374 RepID=A0A1F5YVT3_9BACT|nr:MAG: hypothetical protein A2Z33_04120 [Candidatus Gottesmanbacteria bacterium RBG_16_52_11]
MTGRRIYILAVLLAGLLLRLWLSDLAPKNLEWDAYYYFQAGRDIAAGTARANCCNMAPGYPLFLAVHQIIFGPAALSAVRISQAVLDLITAVLVYVLARRLFGAKAAMPAFTVAALQPLTPSYTGLILTETLTLTLVTGAASILTARKFSRTPYLWFALGAVLGYTAIVKMSLFQFTAVMLAVMALYFVIRKKWLFVPVALGGFAAAVSYSVYLNLQTFGIASIVPPYRTLIGPLYISSSMGRSGEMQGEPYTVTPEYTEYIGEYYRLYNSDPEKLVAHDRSYREKLISKIKSEPGYYVRQLLRNNIWMWDKYHLFIYRDPFYPADAIWLRTGNLLILSLHLVGLFSFVIPDRRRLRHPLVLWSLAMGGYTALAYPVFNNETRLSLPYYPLVFLWAGYGIWTVTQKILLRRQS